MVVLSLTKSDLSMNVALSIAGSPVYDISNRAYKKGVQMGHPLWDWPHISGFWPKDKI